MSLFKQIALIMSAFLFLVLVSVMVFNFQSAKQYAQEELSNNAQNTASYLSLSLTNAKGNQSKMSTMISAVFDSGYYQEITLFDTDNKIIYQRTKEKESSTVPLWFKSLYDFQIPPTSATVSSGWNPVGTVQVFPLEENAHVKLYKNFLELLKSFAVISFITFTILYFLLRFILSSLKKLKVQAESVSQNNFIVNDDIPSTVEFKEVTLAMNKMVTKVKDIFEKEAASVKDYHKLLYTDTLTGLGNRNFFELKLNDFISSQEGDTKGIILTMFFDGVIEANKAVGHENVNEVIKELSDTVVQTLKEESSAVITRIDGTKISVIFPSVLSEDIETFADDILTQAMMRLEKSSIQDCDWGIKLVQLNYNTHDTTSRILDKIEKALSSAKKNSVTYLSIEDADEKALQKEIIESRIKEHSIALALQDVYSTQGDILHAEAYVRLFDEDKNMYEAGDFIPLVHKMRLDTKLDQNVINYAIKEPSLQETMIAINISARFIQDKGALSWLKERLASVSPGRVFNFEVSNQNLLGAINEAQNFSNMLHEAGHNFGIDRFSIEHESNLNYLQMLKPEYIKINSSYLNDMLQSKQGQTNNALQILIESLDIKIIATNLEDKKTRESLEKVGIKYFQGSLLTKPKLV